jgi:hypothetical protein
MKSCPSRDELKELLSGELPNARENAVDAHIDGCVICQEVLEQLTDASRLGKGPPENSRRPDVNAETANLSGDTDKSGAAFLRDLRHNPPTEVVTPHENLAPCAESLRTSNAPHDSFPQPIIPGYEVIRELGRGGMGIVYQARQLDLQRMVAIKMLLTGTDADARFRAEAEAIARLQHANIVQIHEVGKVQGHSFLVLEYVDGGTLADRIDGTPLPSLQAVQLVAVLAGAVQFVHERGILHRDLKPSNVP